MESRDIDLRVNGVPHWIRLSGNAWPCDIGVHLVIKHEVYLESSVTQFLNLKCETKSWLVLSKCVFRVPHVVLDLFLCVECFELVFVIHSRKSCLLLVKHYLELFDEVCLNLVIRLHIPNRGKISSRGKLIIFCWHTIDACVLRVIRSTAVTMLRPEESRISSVKVISIIGNICEL